MNPTNLTPDQEKELWQGRDAFEGEEEIIAYDPPEKRKNNDPEWSFWSSDCCGCDLEGDNDGICTDCKQPCNYVEHLTNKAEKFLDEQWQMEQDYSYPFIPK